MKRLLVLSLGLFSLAASAQAQSTVSVNCNKGESLNKTLARLSNQGPLTVSVSGTCTEFIHAVGFENLTLKAAPGATLVQPATGGGNLGNAVLSIESSRSVTVSGFSFHADTFAAIQVAHGSNDIRLEYLNVQGSIFIDEHSQVLLFHVIGRNAGFATLAAFDLSDVHVEHCLFEDTTGTSWHSGIFVGAAHITMFDTTIRNMQVGIDESAGADVDLVSYNTYTPSGGPTDVLIDSPAGNNYQGISLQGRSSINVNSAKLIIEQAGQPWGWNSGGILVSDGSTLTASDGYLVITGSYGQGILVENNSHATLTGASVTGSGHGGLVLANSSTVEVSQGNSLTLIGGNGVDLYCDSVSRITGGANLAGVSTSQCANVLPAEAILP